MKRYESSPTMLQFGMLCIVFLFGSSEIGATEVPKSGALRKSHRVSLVFSYPPGEWYHGILQSLEAALRDLGRDPVLTPFVYHSEYWVAQSVFEREKERLRLKSTLEQSKPDAVLLCDDEAADFLAMTVIEMKIPLFVTGINRESHQLAYLNSKTLESVAGTLEIYPYLESLKLLKRLKPDVQTMSILTSGNVTSRIIADQLALFMRSSENLVQTGTRLRRVYVETLWETWKTLTPEINRSDDALWILVPWDVRDSHNQEVPLAQMGEWLKRHLKIPVIGIVSIHTKMGFLASVNLSPEALGRQAAEQLNRFWKGDSLSKLGFEKSRYYKMEINQNEAERLKIKIPQDLLGIAHLVEKPELRYGR